MSYRKTQVEAKYFQYGTVTFTKVAPPYTPGDV